MNDTSSSDAKPPPDEQQSAERHSPLERRSVRLGLLIGLIIVIVALGLFLFHWLTVGRYMQSTNDAYLQADEVTVAPQVTGYVTKVLVTDNEDVRAGQPLVVVDSRDLETKVAQAQGQIEQAQASIRQTEAQIHGQLAQIAQTRAQLGGYRSSATYAQREVDRYVPLAQTGDETTEKLDQVRQTRDQNSAQAQAGVQQVLGAQRQLAVYRAQIGSARAQIAQGRAQLTSAQIDAGNAVLRTSIDGRIGDRSVEVGQLVQPGTKLMSVVPVRNIYVVANFKETQIVHMRPGQSATVSIDALGGRKLNGTVVSFSPGTGSQFALIPPSNATGNFTKIVQRLPVKVAISVPDDARAVLAAGLSVVVTVDTRDRNRAPAQ